MTSDPKKPSELIRGRFLIDDIHAIPQVYFNPPNFISINFAEIKRALADGILIPGIRFEPHSNEGDSND